MSNRTLVEVLKEKKMTIAVAESLTGGLLASSIVDVPGASEVFLGGIVSYSHTAKAELLGVDQEFLSSHGAVNSQVAQEMCSGARKLFHSDIAISTTGVAGPGSSEGKPAGTVFVGIAMPEGIEVFSLHLEGSRQEIRDLAVNEALTLTLARLSPDE